MSPTTTMVKLNRNLPRHREPGLDNPLGARALYLYQGNRDTLFRIHGTNEPWSIGDQVSSGCIRMLNEDILDLYNRVPVGATVLVKRNGRDILFRIHGTNEPWSIGEQVSSGCIRMLNEDVVDLFERVPVGATVYVKRNGRYRV